MVQDTWGILSGDAGGQLTAVAVGIAKLGEPAVVGASKLGGGFVASGRAPSVAAGRLSYVYGLKASTSFYWKSDWILQKCKAVHKYAFLHPEPRFWFFDRLFCPPDFRYTHVCTASCTILVRACSPS